MIHWVFPPNGNPFYFSSYQVFTETGLMNWVMGHLTSFGINQESLNLCAESNCFGAIFFLWLMVFYFLYYFLFINVAWTLVELAWFILAPCWFDGCLSKFLAILLVCKLHCIMGHILPHRVPSCPKTCGRRQGGVGIQNLYGIVLAYKHEE